MRSSTPDSTESGVLLPGANHNCFDEKDKYAHSGDNYAHGKEGDNYAQMTITA